MDERAPIRSARAPTARARGIAAPIAPPASGPRRAVAWPRADGGGGGAVRFRDEPDANRLRVGEPVAWVMGKVVGSPHV